MSFNWNDEIEEDWSEPETEKLAALHAAHGFIGVELDKAYLEKATKLIKDRSLASHLEAMLQEEES